MQPETLVKKIRENLVSQKERLTTYLKVLDEENNDIKAKDADKLLAHISIEKSIIDELASFRKILEPLDLIYSESPYKKDDIIDKLNANNLNKIIFSNYRQKKLLYLLFSCCGWSHTHWAGIVFIFILTI